MGFDVLIIGAGPSGLFVGERLKKEGLNICIVEKGKIDRTTKTWLSWKDIIGQELGDCILNEPAYVTLRGGGAEVKTYDRYVLLDEEKALRTLSSQCGDNVFEGERFLSFKREGNKVKVRTDKRTLEGDMLIDGSGFDSPIYKLLNPNAKEIFYDCYGHFARNVNVRDEREVVIAERLNYGSAYGWFDPFGSGKAFAGVFYLTTNEVEKRKMKKTFDFYTTAHNPISPMFKHATLEELKYGKIRITQPKRWCSDNVLLIGDSAGWAPSIAGVGFMAAAQLSEPISKAILSCIEKGDLSKSSIRDEANRQLKLAYPNLSLNREFQSLIRDIYHKASKNEYRKALLAFSKLSNEARRKFFRFSMSPHDIKKSLFLLLYEFKLDLFKLLSATHYPKLFKLLLKVV